MYMNTHTYSQLGLCITYIRMYTHILCTHTHVHMCMYVINYPSRTGGVTQVIERLPSKLKALSLNPSTTKTNKKK
jgi:hypothetical protein